MNVDARWRGDRLIADLNGDGHEDIVATSAANDGLSILLATGAPLEFTSAAGASGGPLMAGPSEKVVDIVVKQIGKRLTKLAARKAGSRVVGHVSRGSRAWNKAFQHIRAHFRPLKGKPSHAVFSKRYRNEAALKELVKEAAARPSRAPVITKLTIGKANLGRPAVVLERQFKQAIGTLEGEACHVLRVVIDYTGRPITAYPVKGFITSASSKATAKAVTAGAVGIVATTAAGSATAQSPLSIYAELLALERAERDRRSDEVCDPDGVLDWVVDLLFSPSCIAPEPHQLISRAEVDHRVRTLTAAFVRKAGLSGLDEETKANIRADVIAAWDMGYRME